MRGCCKNRRPTNQFRKSKPPFITQRIDWMISRFFIARPIFANGIAIVTLLFGGVAVYWLPGVDYPAITPPTVVVSTNYPGANAKVVADSVAAPIEQQINGVEKMMYM